MSSLWTPGGEVPISRDPGDAGKSDGEAGSHPSESRSAGPPGEHRGDEEMQAQIAEMRARLASTPVEIVVANHAFELFELAALHLSLDEPQLERARLAIDALACLVDGLGDRLGESGEQLKAGLGQLRLAYVQIQAAHSAGGAG